MAPSNAELFVLKAVNPIQPHKCLNSAQDVAPSKWFISQSQMMMMWSLIYEKKMQPGFPGRSVFRDPDMPPSQLPSLVGTPPPPDHMEREGKWVS